MSQRTASDPAPRLVWLIAAVVAAARTLPYALTYLLRPVAGTASIHLGYVRKDLLAYIALIEQSARGGDWLLSNPFTTEDQEGRFFLPLLSLFGWLRRLTGLEPHALLELSRLPLLSLFLWIFWRLSGRFLTTARDRTWAVILVAFSGGVEGLLWPLALAMPASIGGPIRQNTWPMYGWNSFAAAFNPLWIAGLCLTMACLDAALSERGAGAKALRVGLLWLSCYWVHPYSALVTGAVLLSLPLSTRLFPGGASAARRWTAPILALVAAGAIAAAMLSWQLRDAVFAASSGGMLGPQAAAVFWYPLTLGVLGWLALRGLLHRIRGNAPMTDVLVGWTSSVVLLHSSPLLNGYHFVFHLHAPLCLLAAPELCRWIDRARRPALRDRLVVYAGMLLLFVTPVAQTLDALRTLPSNHLVPQWQLDLVSALKDRPPGKLLGPAELGNLVPAMSAHQVWLGHWFMTPGFTERADTYRRIVVDDDGSLLLSVIADGDIDLVVLPRDALPMAARALGPRLSASERFGPAVLLTVD